MGLMMIGWMSYNRVVIKSTLEVAMEGSKDPFVLQTILDSICVGIVPLCLVLACFAALRRKISPNWCLLGLVVFGFAATFLHLV